MYNNFLKVMRNKQKRESTENVKRKIERKKKLEKAPSHDHVLFYNFLFI